MKTEAAAKSDALSLSKVTLRNMMQTQNILADSLNEIIKRHHLSPEQFSVLLILRDQNGKPAHMSAIQERMIAKTSNTTRLVDRLLLKGLATREVCGKNRRKIDVSITEKGVALLKNIDPAVDAHAQHFANNLTYNELKALNFLLEKYRNI